MWGHLLTTSIQSNTTKIIKEDDFFFLVCEKLQWRECNAGERRRIPNGCWIGRFASRLEQIGQWKVKACTFSQHPSAFVEHFLLGGRATDSHLLFCKLSVPQKDPVFKIFKWVSLSLNVWEAGICHACLIRAIRSWKCLFVYIEYIAIHG